MSIEIEGYRLSPQQKWLWLLSGSGSYAVQSSWLLAGPWQKERVKEALDRAAARHDILRTFFVRPEGMKVPLQVLGDARPEWNEHDLLALPMAAQEERIAALAEQGRRPFDLASGSPVRGTLVRLAPERHVLLLTVSALCSDPLSLRNLVQEIGDACAGGATDGEPVQYLQYSEWQHSVREEDPELCGRDRWLFQGLAEPFGPPLARESPASSSAPFTPEVQQVRIPAGFAADLETLAKSQGATLKEILRAAWHILVWRVTASSPVTIANAFHGRKHESLLGAQGPFVKSVPVSCEVAESDTLVSVLERLRRAAADAEEWLEHYSPEDFLNPDDSPARFPVAFEWEEWPSRQMPGGLAVSFLERPGATDRAKLLLLCLCRDGRLSAELRHDSACLDEDEAARWGERFELLLASLARNPERPLGDLDLLSEVERRALLVDFNRTEAAYPRELTVHQLFADQARLTPDVTAVEQEGRTLTYAELEARSNLLASRLQASGVGTDVVVGLFLRRSPDLVVAMLGALKSGGAYLPLDPAYPRDRLALILTETGAPVVLSETSLAPALPSGPEILCLDAAWEEIAGKANDSAPQEGSSPESLAYVLYTSGSTGRPKGVMVPHRGLMNYLCWCKEAYAVAEGKGAPVHSPLGFDLTVTSLWAPLLSGRKVVLLPEQDGTDGLAQALQPDADFSLVKLTPSHLNALAQVAPVNRAVARALVVGGEALLGEALAPWRAANPGIRIFNEYGPTETVVGCCVHEVATDAPLRGGVPIGRPIANTRLYLLNGSFRPVHEGATGEIYVGGDGVARGYLGNPASTAASFMPDPFGSEPGGRLYRTGDLARLLPDGDLHFLGRNDDQVKIRGYRIELGEIETSLARHPGVGGAVVVVREDTPGDRRLVAYVTGHGAPPPNTDELRRHLLQSLPEHMVPSMFVALETFPLTPNGKVDRRALPVPSSLRPDLEQPYAPPRTATEQALAEIWGEVLGVERVGIHDNYFSLGGDSMRSVRVVAFAKERGLEISLQDLFRFRTIEELSRRIEEMQGVAFSLAPADPESEAGMARLLDEIEALSDEEAHARLQERLGAAGESDRP
jgi:amino acid adenylation domain-containing protein